MDSFLDNKAYDELLNLLNNQHFIDIPGLESDMGFLADDLWLKDSAVIEKIVRRDGFWEIQLLFVHYQEPTKFIKRNITRFTNRKKADLTANYMRRLAAKDQRGTLKVDLDDFNLCLS